MKKTITFPTYGVLSDADRIREIADNHVGCPVVNEDGGEIVGVISGVKSATAKAVTLTIDPSASEGFGPMADDQVIVPA